MPPIDLCNHESNSLSADYSLRTAVHRYWGGPYTKPSPEENLARIMRLVNELMDDGKCIPVCPMIEVHYLHLDKPRDYEFWLQRCVDTILPCAAYLYLPGESSGVEREKVTMQRAGKPLFSSKDDLYKWIDSGR